MGKGRTYKRRYAKKRQIRRTRRNIRRRTRRARKHIYKRGGGGPEEDGFEKMMMEVKKQEEKKKKVKMLEDLRIKEEEYAKEKKYTEQMIEKIVRIYYGCTDIKCRKRYGTQPLLQKLGENSDSLMRRIAKLIWRWNKKLSLKELLTICINLKHENFLLEYNSKDEINKFLKNHGHDLLKPENEKTLTRMLEQIKAK